MRSRAGEKFILVLNEADASVATLYDLKGLPIDTVHAISIWGSPHRLSERIKFMELRRARILAYPAEGETPVSLLRDYLSRRATENKNDALALARITHAEVYKNPKPAAPVAETPAATTIAPTAVKPPCNGPKVRLGRASVSVTVSEMNTGDDW